jgi:hypothetical protein
MTYTAHATMASGTARQVIVEAPDAVEARRRMFALHRAIKSLVAPKPLIAAAVMAALTACGGGGEDDTAAADLDATVQPVSCAASKVCA